MSEAEWVLVRGVVYRRLNLSRLPISRPVWKWYRLSAPPDAVPGRATRWPAAYRENRLPAHEVVTEAKAREVMAEAMQRWRAVFAGNVSRTVADPGSRPGDQR
jgi:hypothetical protein